MVKPIVHIGYKTGTTWLQVQGFALLDGVKRLHDPETRAVLKQLAIGDEQPSAGAIRDLVGRSRADLPVISYEFVSGKPLSGSQDRTRTAHRLAEALPEARILIVVRRQPEILESLHAQYVKEGGTVSLEDFLACEGVGFRLDPQHFEYDRLVSTYVNLFGEPNVLVLPYELLRARPEEFLGYRTDTLGTKLNGRVPPRTIKSSISGEHLDRLRTWNRWFRRSRFNPNPILALPKAAKMRGIIQGRSSRRQGGGRIVCQVRGTLRPEQSAAPSMVRSFWMGLPGSGMTLGRRSFLSIQTSALGVPDVSYWMFVGDKAADW